MLKSTRRFGPASRLRISDGRVPITDIERLVNYDRPAAVVWSPRSRLLDAFHLICSGNEKLTPGLDYLFGWRSAFWSNHKTPPSSPVSK
jgi:hypothetical protein